MRIQQGRPQQLRVFLEVYERKNCRDPRSSIAPGELEKNEWQVSLIELFHLQHARLLNKLI